MRNPPIVSQQKKLIDPANTIVKGKTDGSSKLLATSLLLNKNAADLSNHANATNEDSTKNRRDLILTHKEAQAGSPDDMAACGEEDIGAGLEFLVTRNEHDK